jgi:hypothetical protein
MGEFIEGLIRVLNNEEVIKAQIEKKKKLIEWLDKLGYKPTVEKMN